MKLTTLFFFFCTFAFHAQSNYIAGTVVKKDGTILKGEINYLDWKKTPAAIVFKQNEKEFIFSPEDIESFEVGSDKFIGRNVKLDNTEQRLQKMDRYDKERIEDVAIFLNVLNEGKANLYVYSDYRDHFFFEKNGELRELINRESMSDNNVNVITYKKYLGQLSLIFEDCPNITIKESLIYKTKPLSNLFASYNECNDTDEKTFNKNLNESRHFLYIAAGVSNASMNIGSDNQLYENFNGDAFLTPIFGIAYELNVSKENVDTWSFYNELTYANYKNQYNYSYQRGSFSPDFRNEQIFDFKLTALNLNALVRYKFSNPSNKVRPFINIGFGGVMAISEKSEIIQTRLPNGDETVFNIEMRDFFYSIPLGAGLLYKDFSFELRYTIQDNFSNQSGLRANLTTLGAVISYKLL